MSDELQISKQSFIQAGESVHHPNLNPTLSLKILSFVIIWYNLKDNLFEPT